MRILKEEVELREWTRSTEKTRENTEAVALQTAVEELRAKQVELQKRTKAVIDQLEFLEVDEGRNFGKDLTRLARAENAMKDASASLGRGITGAVSIAAETEAIEALLETKRMGNGMGGGGGSTPGGANSKGWTDRLASALTQLGEGQAAEARDVEQTTGQVRRGIPEEYRRGLDAYFGALERE